MEISQVHAIGMRLLFPFYLFRASSAVRVVLAVLVKQFLDIVDTGLIPIQKPKSQKYTTEAFGQSKDFVDIVGRSYKFSL